MMAGVLRKNSVSFSLTVAMVFLHATTDGFGQESSTDIGEDEEIFDEESNGEAGGCYPACRGGFVCIDDTCVSPCNPPCMSDEVCSRGGQCIPESPQTVQRPASPSKSPQRSSSTAWEPASGEASTAQNVKEPEEQKPVAAVLINPFAMILIPVISKIGVFPLELQFAGAYAGVDLQGAMFFHDGSLLGGTGEFGIRILPQGRGLRGFYIVPRAGITAVGSTGFIGSVELGYAWVVNHFVLNIGGGGVYNSANSEYPFLPFGNISIGLGG